LPAQWRGSLSWERFQYLAFTFVFDRVTGKPVWPIEERPVPQSSVPGEKTSPTSGVSAELVALALP